MLDSTLAAARARDDIFLVTDGLNADEIWKRVESARHAQTSIWLAGALVEPLARRFGVARDGRYWVRLAPPAAQPAWLYRTRDIFASALGLVFLSPLLLLLAGLVKRSSPGPVFYETTGVGHGQRLFIWRKFRSMRVMDPQADQAARREKFRAFAHEKQTGKVIDAGRVTRLGAFLRKYSLDELPQVWSVLKGEMALVGPRPCLPYELDFFPRWASKRFQVRPGLTGMWQVAGRGEVTLEQGLVMDVYYVHARTFALDMQLTLDTVRVMLTGQGDK